MKRLHSDSARRIVRTGLNLSKGASKATTARVALSATSTVAAVVATRLATDRWSPAVFAGVAVIGTHGSNLVGDVKIGRAISRNGRRVRSVVERTEARLTTALINTELLKSGSTSAAAFDKVAHAGGKVRSKLHEKSLHSLADPRGRRTGAKALSAAEDIVQSRVRVPIVGDEAQQWIGSRTGGNAFKAAETEPCYRLNPTPLASEIPVAIIADDFTYGSFRDEFRLHRLTPDNWRKVFAEAKPRMFFCESAWLGGSAKEKPWQGKIYASVRWPDENRVDLLLILDHCRRNKIPTVFWNKEDPTHFADRINDFARTAALFDYVLTTAEECVSDYRKYVGIESVGVLPFAVQPRLFNPQGISREKSLANFAGTWYGNYPNRCAAQTEIFDQVLESGMSLEIYNRLFSSSNPVNKYPEKYRKFEKPSIAYEDTAKKYKSAKFGITLNTVTDSKTMFARRVFELAASGSVVLSNDALGVREFFGDSVIYADAEPDRLRSLTDQEYYELQRSAMRIALQNTYTHRAEALLSMVGIDFQPKMQAPTLIAVVYSMADFETWLARFKATVEFSQLLVVVSEEADQSLEMKLLQKRQPKVTVVGERLVEREEIRIRNFLYTSHFVYLENRDDAFPANELEDLRLHTSHFDGQIRLAGKNEEMYQTMSETVHSGALVPARFVAGIFDNRNVPTFTI